MPWAGGEKCFGDPSFFVLVVWVVRCYLVSVRVRVSRHMTFFCFALSCGRRRELRLVEQEQGSPPVAAVTQEAVTPLEESLQRKSRRAGFAIQVRVAGAH